VIHGTKAKRSGCGVLFKPPSNPALLEGFVNVPVDGFSQ
jgi:hypothetical protein